MTPLYLLRVHLAGLWKAIDWAFKSAGEKAHILQMRHDPVYRQAYYERLRKRRIAEQALRRPS